MDTLRKTRYMQYISAITAAIPIGGGVMCAAWASPSLPRLASDDSPIGVKITVEEASWLVSCLALGGGCVSLFWIFFAELLSRKTWIFVSGACLAVVWIIIYFSRSVVLLCVARFIGGVGNSIAFMAEPMYIAEIVDKDIRGKLSMAGGVAALCGGAFMFIVGPYVSYFNLALICIVPPIVFLVSFYFMPESPYYLVKTGQKNAALESLTRLARPSTERTDIFEKLTEIEETVNYDMQSKGTVWECVSKKDYRMSLLLMLGTKTLLQLSGANVIDSYAQTIIADSKSSISPEVSSVLFGVIAIPAAIVASFLVDRLGRRPLWMVSATGCAIALFGEGLYFCLNQPDHLSWLPATSIIMYIIMAPIGVTTLPFVIVGEIFSTNIKSAAVALSSLYGSVLAFIVLKYAEPTSQALGRYTVLWFFSCICILGLLFVIFIVPETRGKSLEEIQQMLNKDRKTDASQDANSKELCLKHYSTFPE